MSRNLPAKLSLLASVMAIVACNLARTGVPQALASPAVPGSLTATPSTQESIPISATPVHLVIPPGLATGAIGETIDVVTDQTGAPWDVAPAHLRLTFNGYTVEITSHVPQLFVYPADQYAGLNPAAAESLKRLKAVLANPGGSYNQDNLPRVPFFNAGQVFAAQQKVIGFSGGSGVRFITQYAQDISPINNGGLFYHFEGLTDDGKYYLIGVFPTNLPFLAADSSPDSPVSSEGIPFPPSSAPSSAVMDYYQQIAQRIGAAQSTRFSPSLDALDQLIQSISEDR